MLLSVHAQLAPHHPDLETVLVKGQGHNSSFANGTNDTLHSVAGFSDTSCISPFGLSL